MAKYYVSSGDLQKIISTTQDAKVAAKICLEQFMTENKNAKDKSICQAIAVSEKGFRHPVRKAGDMEVMIFDTAIILDMIS